jgi:hypothetical protein
MFEITWKMCEYGIDLGLKSSLIKILVWNLIKILHLDQEIN